MVEYSGAKVTQIKRSFGPNFEAKSEIYLR